MMQVCRAVHVLGSTFLVLFFHRVVMEERVMTGDMRINTEMTPEPVSTYQTTFTDVTGFDETMSELPEVVQFLRQPYIFKYLG